MEMLQGLPEQLKTFLILYGPHVLGAVLIFVIGLIGAKIVTGILRRALQRAKVDPTLTSFLANIVQIALLIFVAIAALDELGVDTKSFAAVLAAAGLAIGLALQGSLGNFAAGVLIILRRPFRVGDFIEAAGISGIVESIHVDTTELRTGDNKLIIVPNSMIIADSITNYSAKNTRRIDLVVGIGYDDDIRKAKELLEQIVKGEERVLDEPAPVIAVDALADSSVNFVVRPWVKTADYWDARWALTEAIKLAFDREGISIPFPQQDVHLHRAA